MCDNEYRQLTFKQFKILLEDYEESERRKDVRAAIVACHGFWTGTGGKQLHPTDVMPWLGEKKKVPDSMSGEQLRDAILAIRAARKGKRNK